MLGKRISYKTDDSRITVQFENGAAYITVWKEDIINVFCPYETKEHRSKAIEGVKAEPVEISVTEEAEALVIKTSALTVKVYDDFYVDFYKADGTLLCADYRGERETGSAVSEKMMALIGAEGHDISGLLKKDYPVQTIKVMDGDEKFYGLGDKSGFLNKRDYEYENWNSDIPQAHNEDYKALYKSIPFLITLKENGVFGLFFDNTYKSKVNLGKENSSYYYYGAVAGHLD